jgi:Benzoyl-CoA reductase/2-hydroxyglutaryl-CoA dehydratase subunit, BcrC/BadD/HgdB
MELSTKKPFSTPKDLSWHERAKWWKDKGKKVLGYLCSDFPEEIVYAGGILPIRILGSNEAISEAYKYSVNPYSCYVTRSILDMALKGELSDFDGLAITTTCDACGLDIYWRMEDQVKGSFPFLYLLPRPSISKTESSHKFFRVELFRFKESLEEFLQEEIPKSSLAHAIKVYNQNRSLLREIYDLRGEGFISGVDAAYAVFSSMGNPKDENNLLLSRMIEEAKIKSQKVLLPSNTPKW